MRTSAARRARRALDRRLGAVDTGQLAVPARGWVRAIREALGMSQAALAARMGVTASAVAALERSEAAGRAQLESLRRAAEAMECDLIYAFVPRNGLDATVRKAALAQLAPHLRSVSQTMALEDQATGVGNDVVNAEVEAIIDSGRVWT
jgi:predicted DNA-binding mobile mystery protein A